MPKKVKADLGKLFRELRIPVVVFVDDDLADDITPGSIMGAAFGSPAVGEALGPLLSVEFDRDNAALPDLVRQSWERMDESGRALVRAALREAGTSGLPDLHRLRELIPDEIEVILLAPAQWASDREKYLGESTNERRTLFLFDEELGDTSSPRL